MKIETLDPEPECPASSFEAESHLLGGQGGQGLLALLPATLQGITEMPWVQRRNGDYFYQVEGLRVIVSAFRNGYKASYERYDNNQLTPSKVDIYPDLPSAIRASEEWIHMGCSNPSFIPNKSWLDIPPTTKQVEAIRNYTSIRGRVINSRWEAQQAMNQYFSKLGSGKRRRRR